MPIYAQYYVWLIGTSLFCLLLERIVPWRREQTLLRPGLFQDLFWLVFNGHYLGMIFAIFTGRLFLAWHDALLALGWPLPESLQLVSGWPLWLQFITLLVVKDFVEWNIHRLLHNVPWLWELHKLHHSLRQLDWIGNFRFHWGEIIVYKTLSYLPLVVLGVDWRVMLAIGVLWTLMLDINHANLPISWGPLRYVLNSPKMHVWHHDVELHGKGGQNFGQVLSVWDWLFGTVYWPDDQERPVQFGFAGQESYPESLLGRLFYPVSRLFRKQAL
ncbi:MAG: sterol desaturase family protein [Acidobacteriota bacterium]|nr:sterol desaturase family protein [Acidobacteriota bacterium]MDH3784411.1 sterol desaturase family protein [Acidobacteriota bacterium]